MSPLSNVARCAHVAMSHCLYTAARLPDTFRTLDAFWETLCEYMRVAHCETRKHDLRVYSQLRAASSSDICSVCRLFTYPNPFHSNPIPNPTIQFNTIFNAIHTQVFQPCKGRKIILSTNIAETSVTIPSTTFIIDPGRAKEKKYDPFLKTSTLSTSYISKSSAKQRMGRAGRVRRGVCFHLFSRRRFESFEVSYYYMLLQTVMIFILCEAFVIFVLILCHMGFLRGM